MADLASLAKKLREIKDQVQLDKELWEIMNNLIKPNKKDQDDDGTEKSNVNPKVRG